MADFTPQEEASRNQAFDHWFEEQNFNSAQVLNKTVMRMAFNAGVVFQRRASLRHSRDSTRRPGPDIPRSSLSMRMSAPEFKPLQGPEFEFEDK